jgi:DNA polymerase-3 subunit alpha
MGNPQFVHLHLHTDYSLLDGACEISELLDEASRQKMPAVAVTDHGNLFAAANFFHEASKRDVKPIIGCEVYVAKGSRHDRGEKAGPPNGGGERGEMEPGTRGSNHLVLLCENLEGYHNLIKLVSAGFLEGFYYKPRIDYDLLSKHNKGLIALSACLRGPVTECVVEEKFDLARENAYKLRDIFGKGNFFLEIQDQGLEIEQGVNRELVRLSKETGIPLVVTNDCHYLHHEDAHAQEVLLCIQTGKTMRISPRAATSRSNTSRTPCRSSKFPKATRPAVILRRWPAKALPNACRISNVSPSRVPCAILLPITSAASPPKST